MSGRLGRLAAGVLLACACAGVQAQAAPEAAATGGTASLPAPQSASAVPATRNGREIYARFREGLADPSCGPDISERWQRHFANAPKQLAASDSDALALFGYVVDALREAHLPTEYALIPFVESGYKPGARSGAGPAGLWQFIALTARNHNVPIRPGYDGRLSPAESTRAAVRYLKTLHGMFAGDWRLAVMAYNAGEYRLLGALKRSGQEARNAQPDKLVGLSPITQGYVRKLHALSCVLDRADDRESWMQALDRPVTLLAPTPVPSGIASLDAWASVLGADAGLLKRLNPAFPDGRIAQANREVRLLAPMPNAAATGTPVATPASAASAPAQTFLATAPATPAPAPAEDTRVTTLADAEDAIEIAPTGAPAAAPASTPPRTHTVARGDSIWRIAERYGLSRADLLSRNQLTAASKLHPGMVLKIDETPSGISAR
ncbi:lytic transglycosylase domain-containing protein [Luteimonas aquatica]|uniref:lytic transglycosylase domain-containing protein n=1 Tax=Luteimonas aquatica TaxID=450364 RepID=UPI001F585604|nr:lytic transglycosylase domain-containing protein [Luteimonas aquatica]